MKYTVAVIREEDGRYTACIPALNDVSSFGDTLPEALKMIEEAARLYLDALNEKNWPVPTDNPQINVDMTEASEVKRFFYDTERHFH